MICRFFFFKCFAATLKNGCGCPIVFILRKSGGLFIFTTPGVTRGTHFIGVGIISIKLDIASSHALFYQKLFIMYQFTTSNCWLDRNMHLLPRIRLVFGFNHLGIIVQPPKRRIILQLSNQVELEYSGEAHTVIADDEVQKENSPSSTCCCDSKFFQQQNGRLVVNDDEK